MRAIAKMMDIIEINYDTRFCKVNLNWYYEDEDIQELGELLMQRTKLNLQLVSIN